MRHNRWRYGMRHCLATIFLLVFLATYVVCGFKYNYDFDWADELTITIANYIGDASFALTGSLAAGQEGMDLLGCVIVGFVTALGGGTFRDIVLGRLPVFWLTALDEFTLCSVVAAMTFFLWPVVSRRWRLTSTGELLFWTDTVGLAVFAASGANIAAMEYPNLHLFACACCGMFTATFGGLTRDVLLGRPPRILYSQLEVYAVPALLGGIATAGFYRLLQPHVVTMESIMLGVWVVVQARVFAVNRDLRLPTFPSDAVFSKEARPRDIAAALARKELQIKSPQSSPSFVRKAFLSTSSESLLRGEANGNNSEWRLSSSKA